jgi:RimJ/RimL family protein N-acetyltransferase
VDPVTGENRETTCDLITKYSALELLADGKKIEIRALRPDDRPGFLAALDRTSAGSLYRRFFSARRDFTPQEVAFFLNVDFVAQVALVAVIEEGGRPAIVGVGRYIRIEPGRAEVAFAVIDQYQGQGIGNALLRHLAAIAHEAGLKELVAEVLPDNIAMLRVFEKSDHDVTMQRGRSAVNVTLRLG